MSFPFRREPILLPFWSHFQSVFGENLDTKVLKTAFRRAFEIDLNLWPSSREVGQGGEGAQRLGRAGSHKDGANFSTYSSLCRAAAETNGRDHRQSCSVFRVLHQNQKYAQNIKGG